MKKVLVFILGITAVVGHLCASETLPLVLQQTISLSPISGQLEHMGIDRARQRLFVAAYGNNSVEVIDLKEGRVTASLTGFSQPTDVLYVPDTGKIYVTNDGDGTLKVLDGDTFGILNSFDFVQNADTLRYDEKNRRIYIGTGTGVIGVIDAVSNRQVGTITFTGHPAAFEVDRLNGRIYINTPSENRIVVADMKTLTPVGTFLLSGNHNNYAMALDATSRRLFVGCRRPGTMVVFDCDTGRQILSIPIDDGINDLFYDEANRRIYCSCGSGAINIIRQMNANEYAMIGRIPTSTGANSSLFLPEINAFFLAVPDFRNPTCEIRRYSIQP